MQLLNSLNILLRRNDPQTNLFRVTQLSRDEFLSHSPQYNPEAASNDSNCRTTLCNIARARARIYLYARSPAHNCSRSLRGLNAPCKVTVFQAAATGRYVIVLAFTCTFRPSSNEEATSTTPLPSSAEQPPLSASAR